MQIVIDIHEKDYHSVMYSNHVPYGVVYAIKNGTPLPKDATNGDMIKVMFPNEEYKEGLRGDMVDGKPVNHKVVRVNGLLDYYVMDYDWWNAPYKEVSDEVSN